LTSIIDPYFYKNWRVLPDQNADFPFVPCEYKPYEGLILKGCHKMTIISELPPRLKVLIVFSCSALEWIAYLPPDLKVLCLFDNEALCEVPSLKNIYGLDAVSILGCPKLLMGRSPYPPALKELEIEMKPGFDLKQLPPNLWSCVMTKPFWGRTGCRVGRILKVHGNTNGGQFWLD